MIQKYSTLFTLFVFCCLVAPAWGQKQAPRFRAGAVLGLTASQIDGDLSAGYNKLGLQAGLRAIARLQRRTEASVEILFAQRGAQSELVRDAEAFGFSVALNYIEVPLQFHFKDWLIEDEDGDYHKVAFNGGLSYARLIGTKVSDDLSAMEVIVPEFLKKDDFSFLLGANFYANRNLCFTLRYVRSIGFMYDPRDWNPAPAQRGWNGHCLYFQTAWLF